MAETVVLVVFALYMLFILGVGFVASRFTEMNPRDFVLADRKIGTVLLTFTLLATIVSAFTFLGIGGVASATGFGLFNALGIEMIAFGLIFATIGVKVQKIGRKYDYVTPTEYLVDRFESPILAFIYILISFVFLTAMVAGQIIGGAIVLDVLMDLPYEWGAVVMTGVMLVYIHVSGMRGVIWSDLIQGVILTAVLIGAFLFIMVTSDLSQLAATIQSESPDIYQIAGPFGVWTPIHVLTFCWAFALGVSTYPQIYQRFLGAESVRILKKSAMIFPLVGIPIYFTAPALGIWALGIIPTPDNPDHIIPMLIVDQFGPIVTGIALSAAVAAIMSTSDSAVLSLSSMFSRDIYSQYINENADDRREVVVTQVLLVILLVSSLAIAIVRPGGIFAIISLAVVGFATITPAVYFSKFWPRATKEGAIVSMVIASLFVLAFFFELIPDSYTFGLYYGFVGFLISTFLFIAISFVSSPPDEEKTLRFVET